MISQKILDQLKSLHVGSVLTSADLENIDSLLNLQINSTVTEFPLLKVRCGRKDASLSPHDVLSIKSTSGSSTLTTREGECWCTNHSMKAIESLWKDLFVRIDRNTAIHRRNIRRVYSAKSGVYRLETIEGDDLVVSRRCYSKIRQHFAK